MKTSHYADRQRCEAAGLGYGAGDIGLSLDGLDHAASFKKIPLLDLYAQSLNLQCAAFLESQYERAGVITGGGDSK